MHFGRQVSRIKQVKKTAAILLFILSLAVPGIIFSKIGVGVGSGQIEVEEKLKPGMIYELPSIDVINTGDEEAEYGMAVAYHNDQPEKKPGQDWFVFTPSEFSLKPGEVRKVEMRLKLPLRTQPGDYFSYLEAHPVKTVEKGLTTIGIAAATKLYFTVEPANIFAAAYYKLITFWRVNAPWPDRVLKLSIAAALFVIFRKNFNLDIKLKKTNKTNE